MLNLCKDKSFCFNESNFSEKFLFGYSSVKKYLALKRTLKPMGFLRVAKRNIYTTDMIPTRTTITSNPIYQS